MLAKKYFGVVLACVLIVGLLVLSVMFAANFFVLRVRVSFARDQILTLRHFEQNAATAATPEELQKLRTAVVDYYPSGTKQIVGSDLDLLVEQMRHDVLAFIDGRRAELRSQVHTR